MDYEIIENLAAMAKAGHMEAKELLAQEFAPLIQSISKKSRICSYEPADIRNECYKTLFNCLDLYNPDRHRFVAYATRAIKNSVNHLGRVDARRIGAEGPGALILYNELESFLYSDLGEVEDRIMASVSKSRVTATVNNLPISQQELIKYIFFRGHSLKRYSELKGITYDTAVHRKSAALASLRSGLEGERYNNLIN